VTISRALRHSSLILFALVVLLILFVVPPAPRYVAHLADPDPLVVKGAIHVHTVRSDGGGTVDDVAAAAAAAGLSYVVITDHGDGRRIEPPSYRSGVLVLDGAEISATEGHVLAIGSRAADYALAGEAQDVIEDIHRLGGIAVVAHPGSPKRDLAWRGWDTLYDGIEWLNADSEWRDESATSLAALVLGYWLRPAAAVARTFDRPERVLERADAEAARRPIVLLAGHDAHARIGGGTEDQPGGRSLPLPSYKAVFQSFAVRAVLDTAFTHQAADDAAVLLRAIRHGRVFTAVDGLAPAGRFTFTMRSGSATAGIGDRVIPAGPLEIEVAADAPEGARIVVVGNGRDVASGPPPRLAARLEPSPGPYRVEVRLDDAPGQPPVPWIVSSPIYVGLPAPAQHPPATGSEAVASLATADAADQWTVEHSRGSGGTTSVSREDGTVQFTFSLGENRALSPYAAAARNVDVSAATAIEFRIHTDQPMRVSVQLRSPPRQGEGEGRRWRRSVYVDTEDRLIRLALSEFDPVPPASSAPDTPTIDSLLFVVDTVNADPGAQGVVTLADVRLLR
jgi:hypothetical protein